MAYLSGWPRKGKRLLPGHSKRFCCGLTRNKFYIATQHKPRLLLQYSWPEAFSAGQKSIII